MDTAMRPAGGDDDGLPDLLTDNAGAGAGTEVKTKRNPRYKNHICLSLSFYYYFRVGYFEVLFSPSSSMRVIFYIQRL